jgi:hypothetical protein
VSAFFAVSGTGATVILTALTAAANDTTMNLASADGTCIGITTAANSANTTAGDVTSHCIYDSIIDPVQTGTTTSGNKVISGLSSTAGFVVGMLVTGTGIGAAPNTIASIDSGTQVTLTVNSTASASVSITFQSLFATIATANVIRIRGSASNDAVYNVATGGLATRIIVTEAVTNEAAGAYITIQKRSTPSNNMVYDELTKLYWRRYTSENEKVGVLSTGKLVFYDATLCFTLHPADANLSINATTKILKITGGAGNVARYNTGYMAEFAGFANAGNNRAGGYRIETVAVNGADLDLTLWTGFSTTNPLTTEAAGGSRSIKIVCQNIFAYVAACNLVSLGGYNDWRVMDFLEGSSLLKMEAPSGVPPAAAFPSWSTSDYVWTSTTRPNGTSSAMIVSFGFGYVISTTKVTPYFVALVRGG